MGYPYLNAINDPIVPLLVWGKITSILLELIISSIVHDAFGCRLHTRSSYQTPTARLHHCLIRKVKRHRSIGNVAAYAKVTDIARWTPRLPSKGGSVLRIDARQRKASSWSPPSCFDIGVSSKSCGVARIMDLRRWTAGCSHRARGCRRSGNRSGEFYRTKFLSDTNG